jgi:hypothetical protein
MVSKFALQIQLLYRYSESCRTHLHLIASPDGGVSWRHVASIEDEIRTGVRIHYPTLLQLDDARVMVSYSRFYLGRALHVVYSTDPPTPRLIG